MMRVTFLLQTLVALLLLLSVPLASVQGRSQLLIISGLGGEAEFSDIFYQWSQRLLDTAEDQLGLKPANIAYLAEKPERDPQRINGRSDKAGIKQSIGALAARVQPEDNVFIVLIGHGSDRDGEAYFNIPGPDISASEFAALLEPLAEQRLTFVNTTPSSGAFIAKLSAPGRTVITATESGRERFHTLFGGHFVAAFAEPGADTDKDGRVSVLEAFEYARREVERAYQSDDRLQTEHALLDDNGDGEGSLQPDPQQTDGALARTVFLQDALATMGSERASDPELAALLTTKRAIEQRIEALKRRKDELQPESYANQLEDLLVELALNNRLIREREAQR